MNIVYSKHAQERISQRKLNKKDIELTILHPDQTVTAKEDQKKYIKTIAGRKYQIIAKYLPAQQSYLIISAWIRGEDDPTELWLLILTAPFKLLWVITTFIWKKVRSHQSQP